VLFCFWGLTTLSRGLLFGMIWERCLNCWLVINTRYFNLDPVLWRSLGSFLDGLLLLSWSLSWRSIFALRKVGTLSPLKQYSLYFWGEVTVILGVYTALLATKGWNFDLSIYEGAKLKLTVFDEILFLWSLSWKQGHAPVYGSIFYFIP
jgi:hypothetical protein